MINFVLLQSQPLPNEFFTIQSMLTLTGATGVVYVVSNSLQRVFDFNPKWLALLIAQIIAIVGVFMSQNVGIGDIFVGVVNGFLIYSTAVGANQITARNSNDVGIVRSMQWSMPYIRTETNKRKFNTKWF